MTDFYLHIANFSFSPGQYARFIGNWLQEPGVVVEIIYPT